MEAVMTVFLIFLNSGVNLPTPSAGAAESDVGLTRFPVSASASPFAQLTAHHDPGWSSRFPVSPATNYPATGNSSLWTTPSRRSTSPVAGSSPHFQSEARPEILECLPHEFACFNKCIDRVKMCDTVADCGDGSDEDPKLCRSHSCPISHYKCNDGYCIPIGKICDYRPDCPDGSDEMQCNYRKCWHGEWRCRNQQCVGDVFLCDGEEDCRDGSDEVECGPEAFLECDNGKRIHVSRQCDGTPDCVDQSDETDCGACRKDQFACLNGRCLSRSRVCDAECDCQDDCADEAQNCHEFYEGLPGLGFCRKNKAIYCNKTNRCVRKEFICDGKDDCMDGGTDEFQCHLNRTLPGHFLCTDGRALPDFALCDFRRHCLHGEDEHGCKHTICSREEFRCASGECIPKNQVCNIQQNCQDGTDELSCQDYPCPEESFKCAKSGQCLPLEKVCDHRADCPLDGSDEPQSCPYRWTECGLDEFRCDNGQCTPRKYLCQVGQEANMYGCSDGSHLRNCSHTVCDGTTWYKCRNGPCYHRSLRCNGMPDCYKGSRTWTDEEGCPFQCSSVKQCICTDVTMECASSGLIRLPEFVEPTITKFLLPGNRLNVTLAANTFAGHHRLTVLDLSRNGIKTLSTRKYFVNLWQLRVLILKDNRISRIPKEAFFGLANVRVLDLRGNVIQRLDSFAFSGLSTLQQLDLSSQRIHTIPPQAFTGLRDLLFLNLSGNPIRTVDRHSFLGLTQLVTLDLSDTGVPWDQVIYPPEAFFMLTALTNLYTSDPRFCCSIGSQIDNCRPKVDYFSSCSDLMSNVVLRCVLWIMGTIALLANSLVIYWRYPDLARSRIHGFLIINLAVGDLFMGAYLLVIAGADLHYRGSYVYFLHEWKRSPACNVAGVLSTISSELSIFTLLVITLDRLFTILLPFHLKIRLTFSSARIAMLLLWLFVLIIAVLPLVPLPYFEHFYGRSGVCLALHLTPERFPGWEYSLFIFFALNMLACILIILAYCCMYAVALRTHRAVDQNTEDRNRKEARLARRMVLIILTNLGCYLPISVLSVLALAEVAVPDEVYSWVAVFMLPVNAALNPLLYTLSTRPFRRNFRSSITYRAQNLRESITASLNSGRRRTSSSTTLQSAQGNKRPSRQRIWSLNEPVPEEVEAVQQQHNLLRHKKRSV